MSGLERLCFASLLIFSSSFSVFGQWFPVDSGTTNNLNRAYLLDSGTGFVVRETGTILKTTDLGATWVPLSSGTTRALHDVCFFDPDQGVAVGDRGLILRTTDGGTGWQSVASGVHDALKSVALTGRTEFAAAIRKPFFTQPIQGLRGRSLKWIFRRWLSGRTDAKRNHRVCCRTKFHLPIFGREHN